MNITDNTILVTGGGTGIGLAITEAFAAKGNKMIICGRRESLLKEAKEKIPSVEYLVADLRKPDQVKLLYQWTVKKFPGVNILVNNAGIQRAFNFHDPDSLEDITEEIEINLSSPVLLSSMFVENFSARKESAIVNVSSGLGFAPIAFMPVYCATKAALHSFTMSMRHQLKKTPVKVFELIPPIVDTDLDQGRRGKRGEVDRGIEPAMVADELLKGMEEDDPEIIVGMAKGLRENGEKAFGNMNP